jgi:hypothetical protein
MEARRANREVVVEKEEEEGKRKGDSRVGEVLEESRGLVMMLKLVKGA